jgi:hypothetical protein
MEGCFVCEPTYLASLGPDKEGRFPHPFEGLYHTIRWKNITKTRRKFAINFIEPKKLIHSEIKSKRTQFFHEISCVKCKILDFINFLK